MSEGPIWMDGELVPFDDATTHVMAHTLHYGMGAFEGIRAYTQPDGRAGIWELDAHLTRLFDSLRILQMEAPFTQDEITEACKTVLREGGHSSAYLRPLAWIGAGALGLGVRTNPVHMAVIARQWGAYLGEEALTQGVALGTSSYTRSHPNSAMQRAKVVGHYVNSILARYEANDNGFDEALMLDQNGFVAEGTGENVFVVDGGRVLTPPAVNILPGITRGTVLRILRDEGIEVVEQFFGRDLFWTCDEAFMVGTAAEVTPIASLDRRRVGAGRRGPLTEKVQAIYMAAVRGEHEAYAGCITLV